MGRQPRERPRERAGKRERARRKVWRVSRYGSAGVDAATTPRDARLGGGRQQRPDAAHRVAQDPDLSSRPRGRAASRTPASASSPNSPAVSGSSSGGFSAVAADVDRQRRACRSHGGSAHSAASGRARIPSRGRGARPARTAFPAPSARGPPGSTSRELDAAGRHANVLEREPERSSGRGRLDGGADSRRARCRPARTATPRSGRPSAPP